MGRCYPQTVSDARDRRMVGIAFINQSPGLQRQQRGTRIGGDRLNIASVAEDLPHFLDSARHSAKARIKQSGRASELLRQRLRSGDTNNIAFDILKARRRDCEGGKNYSKTLVFGNKALLAAHK